MLTSNVKKTSRRNPQRAALWSAVSAIVFTASAQAQTFTWTQISNGDASGDWNVSANWNSGAGPVAGGQNTTANFAALNITTDSTITLGTNQTIGHLTFGDTTISSAGSWVLSGNQLELDSSIGMPTITVNSTVSGSALINSTITGNNGLAKAGAGTLTLGADNSFTGGVSIAAGTLVVGTTGALNGNTVTMTGGAMVFSNTGTYGSDIVIRGGTATLTGPGGTAVAINHGTLRMGANLNIGLTSATNGNGRHTFGLVTLERDVTITGASSTGNNLDSMNAVLALDGGVTVDPNSVEPNSTTTLTFARSSTVTRWRTFDVAGMMSDGAPDKKLGLTLANSNNSKPVVILRGNNTYTGLTRVSGGILLLNGGSIATSNIIIENAGRLAGGSATVNTTAHTITLTGGSNGTIGFVVNGDESTAIQINDSGILDLTRLVLSVTVTDPTQIEYVIADKPVGSVNIVGSSFASLIGEGFATGQWTIDYDGTDANPSSIVLSVPEPGSMTLVGLGLGSLLLRRKRR